MNDTLNRCIAGVLAVCCSPILLMLGLAAANATLLFIGIVLVGFAVTLVFQGIVLHSSDPLLFVLLVLPICSGVLVAFYLTYPLLWLA